MSYILTRVFNADKIINDISILDKDETTEEYQASLSLSDTDFIEIIKTSSKDVIDVAISEIQSIDKWTVTIIDKTGGVKRWKQ